MHLRNSFELLFDDCLLFSIDCFSFSLASNFDLNGRLEIHFDGLAKKLTPFLTGYVAKIIQKSTHLGLKVVSLDAARCSGSKTCLGLVIAPSEGKDERHSTFFNDVTMGVSLYYVSNVSLWLSQHAKLSSSHPPFLSFDCHLAYHGVVLDWNFFWSSIGRISLFVDGHNNA